MRSLVRTDLVKRLAAILPDLPARDLEATVSSFFEAITLQLAVGGRVEIRGFGAFTTRARACAPRTGRNPRTVETVIVRRKRVPYLKADKELRLLIDAATAA